MPTNEGVYDPDSIEVMFGGRDLDTVITDALVELARADDSVYRRRHEERKAKEREDREAAEAREAKRLIARERNSRAHKGKRQAKRPWQANGFARRADWEAAGRPERQE